MAKIQADFFQITCGKNKVPFAEGLVQIAGLPPQHPGRWIDVSRYHVRFHHFEERDTPNFYVGEFQAIRTKAAAVKADLAGNVQAIALADGEGLADSAAFVFNRRRSVLVWEKNRVGPSLTAMLTLLMKRAECMGLNALPILTSDAAARLSTMSVIRKVEVKFAKPKKGTYLSKSDNSVESLLGTAEDSHANVVTVTLAAGRANKGGILGISGLINRWREKDVRKLEVQGYDADEELGVVDLIKDRIREEAEIPVEGREVPWASRVEALLEIYGRRANDIDAQFGDE